MQYESYWQVDKAVDKLFAEKKYDEAIALLDQGAALFPDHVYESSAYKLYVLLDAGRRDDALTALEQDLEQDIFHAFGQLFDPLRESPRFKVIETETERLKALAQTTATMQYEVHTPPDYTPERSYPVFFSLHGDTLYMEFHRQFWPPDPLLNQGYIVVYVQSPVVAATRGFVWLEDYAVSREAVKTCYERVLAEYSIDTDQVLIGGFSGGSIAAIEVALSGVVPVRGFVSLCPSRQPDSCTPENAQQAAGRGVRGVMMEGELEGDVPAEQEMLAMFRAANLPCEFYALEGIGHWFPDDLAEKVNRAIAFILDE